MKESKFTIIKDIQEIYDWLKKMNLCKEPKSIEKAISNCKSNSTNDYYDYRVSELEIDICDVFGGSIPNDVIVDKVVFSISIRGKYFDEKCLFDPVFQEINKKKHENFEYEFNIEVYGHKKIEDIWIDYYSSWHLDKHLEKEGDGENKFYHPLYHLTFGGKNMEKKADIYGQTLILPSPRIAHPPMDAILGIDFIIQNYVRIDIHKKMTSNPDYKRLLMRSQNRLWRPYYAAIGEHWNKTYSTLDKNLEKQKLIPNLQ